MKIKPEHYAHMLEAIRPLQPKLAGHREYLKTDSRVKDLEKRLRWDALWASKITQWLSDTVYKYANDDHVDTALKQIMKELA